MSPPTVWAIEHRSQPLWLGSDAGGPPRWMPWGPSVWRFGSREAAQAQARTVLLGALRAAIEQPKAGHLDLVGLRATEHAEVPPPERDTDELLELPATERVPSLTDEDLRRFESPTRPDLPPLLPPAPAIELVLAPHDARCRCGAPLVLWQEASPDRPWTCRTLLLGQALPRTTHDEREPAELLGADDLPCPVPARRS